MQCNLVKVLSCCGPTVGRKRNATELLLDRYVVLAKSTIEFPEFLPEVCFRIPLRKRAKQLSSGICLLFCFEHNPGQSFGSVGLSIKAYLRQFLRRSKILDIFSVLHTSGYGPKHGVWDRSVLALRTAKSPKNSIFGPNTLRVSLQGEIILTMTLSLKLRRQLE